MPFSTEEISLSFQFCDTILTSWPSMDFPEHYLELGADERGESDALVPARAVHDDGVALREPLPLQQPKQRLVTELVLRCFRYFVIIFW